MSTSATVWNLEDPNIKRIQEQIDWYDKKSGIYQKRYKRIKIIEIIAAALVPFLSALHFSDPTVLFPFTSLRFATVVGTLTAMLGVLITILEGVLQLEQYQKNWVTYRATCEALIHEKFTYIAGAGVYAAAASTNPHALLVERAETIGSQENMKWTSLLQPQKDTKAGS
jgi:hypothetical protein